MNEKPSYLARLSEQAEDIFKGDSKSQAAAICYRGAGADARVLLITSRDTGRWVIPKGTIGKKEDPRDAAVREAREEAGVKGIVSKKPYGSYTYVKVAESTPCIVAVFLLETRTISEKFPEAKQRRYEWVTPIEASRRVDEPELKGLLARFAG